MARKLPCAGEQSHSSGTEPVKDEERLKKKSGSRVVSVIDAGSWVTYFGRTNRVELDLSCRSYWYFVWVT